MGLFPQMRRVPLGEPRKGCDGEREVGALLVSAPRRDRLAVNEDQTVGGVRVPDPLLHVAVGNKCVAVAIQEIRVTRRQNANTSSRRWRIEAVEIVTQQEGA